MADIARSPKQLGNIIHRARKQRGMTQTELANRTGLRQALISEIETGHDGTKMSTIYTLFAALDLELMIGTRSGSTKNIEDIF
jgi:HTH-type transcriptional regulator / antitoxin HipB